MICFVILHYKNIVDTIECVESIKKNIIDAKIVLVSNSLDNYALSKLEDKVDKIIYNNANLGFAKANNIGARYALDNFAPDFIAVINNDTLIKDKNFLNIVIKNYEKYHFDCLGPYIETNNGDSVNPFYAYRSIEEVDKAIANAKKWKNIYDNIFLRNLYFLYRKLKYYNAKPRCLKNGNKFEKNVSLHGCFLVFSKKYCLKYHDVFYNETFLYHEEEFLEYRRNKDGLCFIYDPCLKIFHKEGASLDSQFFTNYKKQVFRYTEILKSLTLLRKVMVNNIEI